MRLRRALFLVLIGTVTAGLSGAMAAGPDHNRGRWVATGGFYEEAAGLACAHCHELDGSGNSSGAFPRLSDQSAWYLYKTLKDFAAGLRPNEVMQTVARALTDAETADVSAYYASIEDAPYPPAPDADQQVVQIGGAIAAVGIPDRGVPACNTCHGEDGIGSPPIYPYLAGQFAPYIEHQLMLWKEGRRDGDPLNIMEFIAKNMTDDQIRAVSLYFASLRPQDVTPGEDAYLGLSEAEDGAGREMPSAVEAGAGDQGEGTETQGGQQMPGQSQQSEPAGPETDESQPSGSGQGNGQPGSDDEDRDQSPRNGVTESRSDGSPTGEGQENQVLPLERDTQ